LGERRETPGYSSTRMPRDRGPALPHPGLAECGRSAGLCWCDSGTGSYRFGTATVTGIWQVHESTPLAIIPINRHQSTTSSSISSLESYSTSKLPQLLPSPNYEPLMACHETTAAVIRKACGPTQAGKSEQQVQLRGTCHSLSLQVGSARATFAS
jgi:hypothetical protein